MELQQLQVILAEVVCVCSQFLSDRTSQIVAGIFDQFHGTQFGFRFVICFGHRFRVLQGINKGTATPYAVREDQYITLSEFFGCARRKRDP